MQSLRNTSFSIILCLFFFLPGTVSNLFSQNMQKVIFEVRAADVLPGEHVYIAGNLPVLGGWAPDAVRMDSVEGNLYRVEVKIPRDVHIEFKFTKGSWGTEAIYDRTKKPDNFTADILRDTVLHYAIPYWNKPGLIVLHGQVTGKVIYHRNMQGIGIVSRDVVVWLPPDYEANTSRRYPVLYMHDGQNLFDPATASFGNDWEVDERADSLIRAGIIEPVIVVGIYCTKDRGLEYSYGPEAVSYMNFIIHTLKPMIDSVYRTKPERLHTATAGSSMGGLISLVMLWSHPEVFSKAACFSPAFKITNLDYCTIVNTTPVPKDDCMIYVYNGGVGLEAALQPGVDDMLKLLQVKGFEMGKNLFFDKDEKAEHSEKSWAKWIANPLLLFYKIKK